MSALADLHKRHDLVNNLTDELAAAREARDATIYELSTEGVTAYRLAKELNLSQQAIAKIIRKAGRHL